MSLVGTRPPTTDEWKQYEARHRARMAVRPGLTGLWQVSGRSDILDFEEVIDLDMKYINNWDIGMDIKLILKTVGIIFTGRGAE
ncbi:MAG: sugar transferase [Oscillospiraceae bacterium]|nr:sugar transferase [Oscillospiraceae bacterium]